MSVPIQLPEPVGIDKVRDVRFSSLAEWFLAESTSSVSRQYCVILGIGFGATVCAKVVNFTTNLNAGLTTSVVNKQENQLSDAA